MKNSYKLAIANVFLFGLIAVGLAFNIVQPLYFNDVSRLSYVITVIMLVDVVLSWWNARQKELHPPVGLNLLSFTGIENHLHYVADNILYVGICGTLVGFIMLIKVSFEVSASSGVSDQVSAILHHMSSGSLTLFNTTLLGVVAYLWHGLLLRIDGVEN